MDFKTLAAGLLLVIFAAAFASANSLDFTSPSYQTACKCDPLTFKAQLSADQAESYSLAVSTQLSAFVTPSISVAEDSSTSFDVIMTSPCSAQAGNYSFVVSAKGSKGNDLQLGGVVGVRECSQLTMTVPSNSVLCGGDEAQFVITLQNKGVFTEEGTLSTDLPSSMYSLSDNKFKLEPGRTKQFTMIVSVPQNAPPATIPFKIIAASPFAYREAFATLSIGGSQCSALRINVPSSVEVQVNQETQVQAQFTNIGSGDDSFAPSMSCNIPFSFSSTAFSLAGGASVSRPIAFKPTQADLNKDVLCTITVRSTKFGTQFTATTVVKVRQLYSGSLASISGNSVDACKGESKTVSFRISNSGKSSSYSLSTSAGTLSQTQISVGENAAANFTLAADTSSVGEKLVTVAASNNLGVTASSQVTVKVRECYAAGVKTEAQKITLCPGTKNSTTLTVSNTGDRQDSFSYFATSQLQTQLSKSSGSINAGASDSVLLVVTAPETAGYSKEYSVSFQAKGKTTSTATITVKTLEEDYCRNLVLSIAPQLPAHQVTSEVKNNRVECEECGSETFEIVLENKGAFDEELALSVQGAAWAFINPASIVLAKGEKKSVFVYLAPPAGTQAGTYDLNFTSRGTRGVFATSQLKVVVLAAGTQAATIAPSPVAATAEATASPSTEASPDASRLSGLFTAGNTISALIIAILGGLVALWLLLGREKPSAAKKDELEEENEEEEPEESEAEEKKKPAKPKKK